jgi:hypothetical protein
MACLCSAIARNVSGPGQRFGGMRRTSGSRLLLGTAVCAAALLATGCAASSSMAGGSSASTSSAAAAGKVGTAGASGPGNPQQRAWADAMSIAAAFVPPPGARQLPKPPWLPGDWQLANPSSTIVSSALADYPAWWIVPGQPRRVLAWEVAHLPRRFTPGDTSQGDNHWDEMFSLPPVAGVLLDRELIVEVADAGGGKTAIRVDGQVTWQPTRRASDLVPATARVVTLSEVAVLDPHPTLPAPVTITDPNVVRRLTVLVNELPLATFTAASCPPPIGNELMLTFRASRGGPVLATVQGPGACGTMQFTLSGNEAPALQIMGSFTQNVLAVAGLRWPVVP